jgi:hypothetical protein
LIRLTSQTSLSTQRATTATDVASKPRSNTSLSEIRDDVRLGKNERTENPMERVRRMQMMNAPQGTKDGDRNEDLRRAISALPRDSHGVINPDLLVDEGKTSSLSQAIERLVLEGLGTGADIAFEHAVDSLFEHYSDDLGFDENDFQKARSLMIKEVREAVADNRIRPWDPTLPAPAAMNLQETVQTLQTKVLARRRLMLEASGDLSRVLAELTVSAQSGESEELAQLGSFLKRFGQAVRARSSKHLRDDAKDRLLSNGRFEPTAPKSQDWGSAFLKKLDEKSLA